MEQFNKAISLQSNFAAAYYNLGLVNLQLKNKNAALEQYRKLQTLDPERAQRLLQLINK